MFGQRDYFMTKALKGQPLYLKVVQCQAPVSWNNSAITHFEGMQELT